MKLSSYLFLSLAALAGLASCSTDADSPADARRGSGSPVVVKAAVGAGSIYTRTNPIGSEAQQTAFNTGDQISLTDLSNPGGEKTVNYQLGAEGWSAITPGEYLAWHSASQRFRAFSPVKVRSAVAIVSESLDITDVQSNTFDVGYVADDQRLLEALQSSDFMTAQTDQAVKEPDTHVLPLEFTRQTARIVINIVGYNDEYNADNTTVQGVEVRAADHTSNTAADKDIDAYTVPEADISTEGVLQQFVCLVCPTNQNDGEKFLTLHVADRDAQMDYKDYNFAHYPDKTVTGIPAIEAGKSYTYNLTVGKNTVKVSSVNVADWGDEELVPSGNADRNHTRFDNITRDHIGWVMTSEGRIFRTAQEATAANEHPVAMIAYVGYDTGDNYYRNGLAIALTDYRTIDDNGNAQVTAGYWWFDGAEDMLDNTGIPEYYRNSVRNFVDTNKIPRDCGKWRLPKYNDIKHIIAAFGGTPYEKGDIQSRQRFNPGTFLTALDDAGSEPMDANGQKWLILGDGREYGNYDSPTNLYFARSTWLVNFGSRTDHSDDYTFWYEDDWNNAQYRWDRENSYPRVSRLVFPF